MTEPFQQRIRVLGPGKPHVVVTWEGDAGLSAVSPQLPGFSYGRPTTTGFIADYKKVLRDAGVLGDVLEHEQRRFASPEGTEYVIRVVKDEHWPGVSRPRSRPSSDVNC